MSKPLFTIALDVRFEGIDTLIGLLREFVGKPRPRLTGGKILITVKDDNPDVAYTIAGVTVQDAEGNTISNANLNYEVTSTDDSVVAVNPDAAEPMKGIVSFGKPGTATVNVLVKDPNGKAKDDPLGSFAANFTVTTGDPASVSGGSISFDGLADSG